MGLFDDLLEEDELTQQPVQPQSQSRQGGLFDDLLEEDDIAPATQQPAAQPAYQYDPSGFRRKKPVSPEAQKEIGTLEGIANAARNAFDSSRQALDIVGDVTPEEAKNIAKIEFDKKSRKIAPGYDEYQKAEGFDAVLAFAKNPIEVTSNIVAEGLAGSLPALGAGLAAGGVGAAIGAPTVIGAPIGFTAGQVAGTFAGSLATEYGSKILEEMQEGGVDLTKPESIQGFFENEEAVAAARDKAISRGIPVAAFDAISAGIGGKLGRVIGKQFLTKTGEAAAELGVQAGLGGGGEVAGALVAGEPIEGKAVFGEVIGEAGPGAAEIITGRMADRAARVKAEEDAKIKAAAQLSDNLEQNSAPLTAAVVKSTTATTIEQDKLAAQLDEQLDAEEIEKQVSGQLAVTKEPTAAPPAIKSKEEFTAIYSQVAPEELDAAEAGFAEQAVTDATEEGRISAQNALEAIKEVKATVTPPAPPVAPTITPAVTPAVPTAQPTITDATQEIIQPEGVRQESQDGTQVGATTEASVSDSILGAEGSQEKGQVVPTTQPIISEIPTTSELVGAEPTQPTIREVPEISPIVGAEPTTIVEQEPVAPTAEAPTPVTTPPVTEAVTPAAAPTPAAPEVVEKTALEIVPQEVLEAFSENQPIMERVRKDALEKKGGSLQTYITASVRTKGVPKSQIQPITNKILKQFQESGLIADIEEAVTNEVENISSIKEKKKSDEIKLQAALQRTGETYELDSAIQDYKNKQIELERAQKSMLTTPALRQMERVGAKNNLEKSKQTLISIAATPAVSEAPTPKVAPAAPTPAAPEAAPTPVGISVGSKVKYGTLIRPYIVEEVIPQTAREIEEGDQFYRIRSEQPDKNGKYDIANVEKKDIKPILGKGKGKGARKTAAAAIDTTPEGILTTPPDQQYTFEEVFDVAYDMFGGEIPEGFTIVNDSKDKDFEFKAAYIPESGEIIVNLAYLNKSDDIRDTITHELGHYIFGDPEFRAAFDQFIASLSPEARAELDAYVETAYNKETGEIRLEEKMVRAFVDQFISEEQAPAWRSMLDAIKRFLNKLGFKFNISDRDAISVFTAALDRYKAGEAISREGGARKIIDDLTAMDAEYLAAVERGDMETAQRMVDEAAKKAGYDIKGFHRTPKKFTEFIPGGKEAEARFWTTKAGEFRTLFGQSGRAIWFGSSPENLPAYHNDPTGKGILLEVYLKNPSPLQIDDDTRNWARDVYADESKQFPLLLSDEHIKSIRNDGYTGIEYWQNGKTAESSAPDEMVVFDPTQIKSSSPVTYDDAGDVIPLSQRFRPTSPDIRRMAAEPTEATPADEARREQVAGMKIGRIITTPPGITQKTTDIIRNKFFDSTKVSPENTSQAWAYISQFMDKTDNNNNKFAGYVNQVTEEELAPEFRKSVEESMGASLFSVELANYAGRLAVQGDTKMLAYMIRNGNKMPTGEFASGVSQSGRVLNAFKKRLSSDISGVAAYETELESNVERLAAVLFGTNTPSKEQIKIAQDALTQSESAELDLATEVADDIKRIESRTNKDILKKIDDFISGYDNPKKDQLLLIFANLIRSRDVDGITISYKPAKVSISDRIANLLVKNLANYRDTLVDKAASGLESTFWRTMSSQENKPGLLGELDQAQNNELAKIVKTTLIKMKLAGEPKNTKMTDIEKVASILNESKLSEEKRIEADKRIVAEIDRRRQEELSTTNNPDAVNAKYDSILKAWNDSMSRQLNMPVSDSMLQRLISSEMKEQDIKIRDLVDEADGKVVVEKKQNIINSIIRKIYGVSKESETGIEMDENYDGLKSYLEQTLDNMYALSVEEKNAAYAKRQAQISLRNTAESQAQSIINRLADQLSDTPAFPEKQENEVKAIVQQDLKQIPDMNRKQPWTSQLTAKLMRAGVSETQAQIISDLVWRQHEIKAMDRESKELQTAAEKGSLAVIIDRIKNTPLEKQQSPEWKQEVIKEYLRDAGLSSKAAETAAKLYDSVISERLAAAKQKAFEDTLAKAAPWNNYASRNGKLAKDALKKIRDAIRTGVLDPEKNAESIIAAQSGWTGFTKEQYQRIVELDTILNDPNQDDITKREAMFELNKIITKAKMPVRFKDALGAYYIGNALMGIPTALVNIVSPISFSIRNLMVDIAKYTKDNPAKIPVAFETFLDSMRSWYNQTSYAFKNQIYLNDVVEYLNGQNVLRETFDKGKKQWAEGKYAEGFANMAVGMTQITGRVLSALDQGAISMLENQNITRYAMAALENAKKKVPKDKIVEFANMTLDLKRRVIIENIAAGMDADRAGVLADLAVKSELRAALSEYEADTQSVLDSAINDALQSVGRNKVITIEGIERQQKDVSDSGILSYWPIKMLETVSRGAGNEGSGMQIFSKMVYGFALVPARTFHTAAWFSPYGFLRLAIDKYKTNKGQESPYAMSLQTEAQYRQRLTESIAGSIAMLGLFALRSGSSDEDEDKKFKIVITGNGPNAVTDKQYYDSWIKKYKPYSINIVLGDTVIPINIGRGGEALFFPIMLAGALDDYEIKSKQNLTKKEPDDLNAATEMLGSAFFALSQRGPYAAFTEPLFDASKQGRVTENLVSQLGYFGKTFVPVLGASITRNISDIINDPVDRSSIEGAIYANTPIIGPWVGTKALNALGQPIRADDWGDKLYKLGVPVVFSFPKNTPENELNELILKQGGGPTLPTRANAQKRFGDVLTSKEFETYVREYGRVMSDKMFKNRTRLANMKSADYDDELEKYARGYSIDGIKIKGASDSAVLAVKRMRQ